MTSRVIVTGIVLIITVTMLAFIIEFFLPLSIKSDMNILCRNTLLSMETDGGLSEQDRIELNSSLRNKGFSNISVDGTTNAKQGELLNLHVEAEYIRTRINSLFGRGTEVQLMIYDKSSLSRKVVN